MSGSPNGQIVPEKADEIVRLRRENRAYAREMENLRVGAKVVVDEIDTRELVKSLARLAAQMLNSDRAMIGVVEDDAIFLEASYSNGQTTTPDVAFETDRGASAWVLTHRQPYLTNDPANDPQFGAAYAAKISCRNALCVPILNHQALVIGVIEVHNRRDGGWFTAEDQRSAQILAMQASIGLGRARLFDQMTDWSRSLEMLLAFNGAINQHLNPSMLVRKLVENAARFLKADGGMAGLAIPSGEDDGATVMISEAYWSRGKWHERPRRWERQEGLPGHILENEFPYLSNEYQEDKLADAGLVEEFDVRRALNVPIKDAEDRLLGFFELHKCGLQSAFSWQDAAFLESLANTTAVAIQNAQLLKTLEIKSQQIQALSAFHVTRLEEERRHISRELHDEAGQVLIGIKLGLQVLARQLPAALPDLRGELDRMRELVNQSTRQLKDLAKRLRPPTLDQLGLDVAIRQLAFDHGSRTGMAVALDLNQPASRLPQTTEIAIYRVAQEALTNVAKHSEGTQVWLSLHSTDRGLEFALRDDGKGFDLSGSHSGLGLLGMKERIDMLMGRFEIQSQPGRGTVITVVVPES